MSNCKKKLQEFIENFKDDILSQEWSAASYHKLNQILIWLKYFDTFINTLNKNHWFAQKFLKLKKEKESNGVNQGNAFTNFFHAIGRQLNTFDKAVKDKTKTIGNKISAICNDFKNWKQNFFIRM